MEYKVKGEGEISTDSTVHLFHRQVLVLNHHVPQEGTFINRVAFVDGWGWDSVSTVVKTIQIDLAVKIRKSFPLIWLKVGHGIPKFHCEPNKPQNGEHASATNQALPTPIIRAS